jgi:hypothetical protein
MEEEVRNIPGLNESDVVVIRKFGYKSMKKIRNKVEIEVVTDPVTGKQSETPHFSFGDLQLAFFVYGIKTAPFFKEGMSDADKIAVVDSDDFDTQIVDYLYPKISALNSAANLDELKKK